MLMTIYRRPYPIDLINSSRMLWVLLLVATVALIAFSGIDAYSFLSVGDWGGAFVGYEQNVYAVAAQMNTTAINLNAQFIIGTGDNFYWCGIQYVSHFPLLKSMFQANSRNMSDLHFFRNTSDPQIEIDYVQPYSTQALQVPWYHTLGVSLWLLTVLISKIQY